MATIPPKIKVKSLVAVGKFNPAIVHPQWIYAKGLISEAEAENAELEFNHPEASQFNLEFFQFSVTTSHFSISTMHETHFASLEEMFIAIFKILHESPVISFGLNLSHHFEFNSKEQYASFGHRIVEKGELWSKVVGSPGLAKINIRGDQIEGLEGNLNISVGLSSILNAKNVEGVEILVNSHHVLMENNSKIDGTSTKMLEILQANSTRIMENNLSIIDSINKFGVEGTL